MLKNCIDACIGGLVWYGWGYAFAYGNVDGGFIGTKYFFIVSKNDDQQFGSWFFQFCFACTAASITSGSVAERINLFTYLCFSFYITSFIYPIIVAWTWGGGWLSKIGYQDFAGSGIVHLTGGAAGFMGAYFLGPRIGKFNQETQVLG